MPWAYWVWSRRAPSAPRPPSPASSLGSRSWIPAHRPAETVASELNVIKAQRSWVVTRECTEVTGKSARDFCQQFHKLNAELASAQQSQKLESRISEIGAKLAKTAGGTVMA